ATVTAYQWQLADDDSAGFLAGDPRSTTLRMEDLVTSPEQTLRQVCAFLGEDYEPQMAEPGESAGSLVNGYGWWKAQVSQPVDAGRANAWQSELSAADQARVALIAARGMRRHHYDGAVDAARTVRVRPLSRPFLDGAATFLEQAADAGVVA